MAAPEDNKNNPNIVEAGKATQFGQPRGADPSSTAIERNQRYHSIRRKLRKLACHIPGTETPTVADMAQAWGKTPTTLSIAEIWALRKAQQAMADAKAMDKLIEHVDGKQVEKKANANVSLADILSGKVDDMPIGGEDTE